MQNLDQKEFKVKVTSYIMYVLNRQYRNKSMETGLKVSHHVNHI